MDKYHQVAFHEPSPKTQTNNHSMYYPRYKREEYAKLKNLYIIHRVCMAIFTHIKIDCDDVNPFLTYFFINLKVYTSK